MSVCKLSHCFHRWLCELLQVQNWQKHWHRHVWMASSPHKQVSSCAGILVKVVRHVSVLFLYIVIASLCRGELPLPLTQEGFAWHVKPQWCNACHHFVTDLAYFTVENCASAARVLCDSFKQFYHVTCHRSAKNNSIPTTVSRFEICTGQTSRCFLKFYQLLLL